MPLDIIPVSLYPFVPNVPGVPQLARALNFIVPPILKLLPAAMPEALFHAVNAAPVWGVFDDEGNQVITPDSVLDLDYRAEYRVANFPVQQGEFASYNKVRVPFETSVRLVKGGDLTARAQFQTDCQSVADSLDLYTIVSPERSYLNCNVTRMGLARRQERGAYYLDIELYFIQIQEVSAQYNAAGTQDTSTKNAQQPASRPVVNQGYVQPQNVGTQSQQMALQQVETGAPIQ